MNYLYTTGELKQKARGAGSLEEYKQEVLAELEGQRESWTEKINEIAGKYSIRKMAQLCGVSRQCVMKWRKGAIPQNREHFIRIGLAAGYDHRQMDAFLERYGRCPKLYPKSLDDSILIFVLEKEDIPSTYDSYEKLLQRINEETGEFDFEGEKEEYETSDVMELILSNRTEKEFVRFLQERMPVFQTQFHKLYQKLKSYIQKNIEKGGYHSLSDMATGWSSSMHKCLTKINKECWYPKREKLILLGIHLNLDVNEIDDLLRTAHMSPLYARNILENAILYSIDNIHTKKDGRFFKKETTLCNYVGQILTQLDIPEAEFFKHQLEG